jgi:hypothetical protein
MSERDVFINCPFDSKYQIFFRAIVFVVVRSGFRPRCSLETDDSSENRYQKICKIIKECRYGIHDISRTELDPSSGLPRFNMPLELGVFLGAKYFGGRPHKSKCCIVFDKERYRFQTYISDISGQDIHCHQGKLKCLFEELASWLRNQSGDSKVPGGRRMAKEFDSFRTKIPKICAARKLDIREMTFGDYAGIVVEYVLANARSSRGR